jgi:hypothetical protein
MKFIVPIEGMQKGKVTVVLEGIFSNPRLMVDNMPAAPGTKKGEFIIPKNDGKEITANFKNRFMDAVPNIVVDGKEIILVEPLKWYQWIWAGLPVLLVFGGGAIGGAVGFIAASISARIFRSDVNIAGQYAIVALVSAGTLAVYFILAYVFTAMLQ